MAWCIEKHFQTHVLSVGSSLSLFNSIKILVLKEGYQDLKE
jgi:hypothetical protein